MKKFIKNVFSTLISIILSFTIIVVLFIGILSIISSQINNNELKLMKKRLIIDSRRLLVNHNLDVDYSAIGMG